MNIFCRKISEKVELFLIMFAMVAVIMLIQAGRNLQNESVTVLDSERTPRQKVITTVCVEKNSTLWEIASRYYTQEYKDINAMVQEIKKSNGIQTDTIHEGSYLIVPHYVPDIRG